MRHLREVNVTGIRPDRRGFRLVHPWSGPTDKPVFTNDRSFGSVAAASAGRRKDGNHNDEAAEHVGPHPASFAPINTIVLIAAASAAVAPRAGAFRRSRR
jgi:hypothetical protein